MQTQNRTNPLRTLGCALLMLAVTAFTPVSGQTDKEKPAEKASEKPKITLLEVPNIQPGPDDTGPIKGKVSGVSPDDYKIVIYSKGGDSYYVQPRADSPFTDIDKDGKFSEEVHGGTEYVALLVKKSFEPKARTSKLPEIGDEVVAIDKKKPSKNK